MASEPLPVPVENRWLERCPVVKDEGGCEPTGMPGSRASDDIPRYGVGAGGAPTSGGGYVDTGGSSPTGGMLISAPAARIPQSIC